MITRRFTQMKPIIAVPKGSIVPANIEVHVISEGTFLDKLFENRDHTIAIMQLSTEELIALVEKPHLFGADVIALVGVPGGRYDAVWSSYTAPLRRVSLDTLDAEVKAVMSKAASEPRVNNKVTPTVPEDPDASDDLVLE